MALEAFRAGTEMKRKPDPYMVAVWLTWVGIAVYAYLQLAGKMQ
jgi:hypothetical protein